MMKILLIDAYIGGQGEVRGIEQDHPSRKSLKTSQNLPLDCQAVCTCGTTTVCVCKVT